MQFRQTGAMDKRKGYQHVTESSGGYGQYTFNNVNTTTGIVTEELLTVDDNLYKTSTESFTITYSGSNVGVYYNMSLNPDDNKFYFELYDDNARVLNYDLGNGLEASPVTVNDLISAITAVSDFSAGAASGGGSQPAAYIPIARGISVSTTVVSFEIWEAISTPGSYTNPFTTHYGKRTTVDFENATFIQAQNVLYISNGYDVLHKYDGTRVYKAGMPKPADPTTNLITGSSTLTGTYKYKYTYQYTDAKGNILEGEVSDEVTATPSSQDVEVTVTNLLAASGYDTDGTLEINLFRTKDAGSTFYLHSTVSNNAGASTQVITDTTTDANLGAEFVPPIKIPGLPPTGKYIDFWRGHLIITGDNSSVDTVYYSDINKLEAFDPSSSFIVDNKTTGLRAIDNVVYVFQEDQISGVTGDFTSDNFQVDKVSREGIGCVAHHTIQEVVGRLMFLSKKGVFAISTEKGLEHVGSPIDPKFQLGNVFTFKQAVAFNWRDTDKYLLFMPNLPVDPSYSLDTSNQILVYDYFRGAWLEWNNYNFMGGISVKDGELYITRRVSGEIQLSKILSTNTQRDYADHHNAITFTYKSHWETLGEPTMWKKFLRTKIHSYDVSTDDFESDKFTITLKTEHDYREVTRTNIDYDMGGGNLGWGLSPWGNFRWGEPRLTQLKKKIASKKSRSIRFILENSNTHENVLISGYEVQVATPYKPDMKE